ncbi:MAG: hypothetical protein Q9227_004044 [Pyrenula ochraceoflavens]
MILVVMDTAPFYEAKPPLRFRGIPDTLAKLHLEGSECCLVHADNPLSQSKGVYLNPNVRVGYNPEAYNTVHRGRDTCWLSSYEIFLGLWRNRILRWTTTTWLKSYTVARRLSKWKAEKKNEDRKEPDLFWSFTDSVWNTVFKLVFIGSSAYTLYLMLNDYRPTHDPNLDTFKVSYLLGGSAVVSLILPADYTMAEILWTFSIWLEAVAILPQLFMLQRTGEAETITTHYLFALGIYRALYIPNWIYRYLVEGAAKLSPHAVAAGILQTVLYSDFFWVYYTK